MGFPVQIPTKTILETIGGSIKIFTYYSPDELPYILFAFIADEAGTSNGISYIEGELVVIMIYYPEKINVWLNSQGDFIVNSNDALNYKIDNFGELIWES